MRLILNKAKTLSWLAGFKSGHGLRGHILQS